MDDTVKMRLNILRDSGEISNRIADALTAFIKKLEGKYYFVLTEDNGAMFVTHLAAALGRIERGDTIEAIEPTLLAEARQTPHWGELPGLMARLEQEAGLSIPEQERGYLALHMAVMLEKAKGGEGN